MPSLPPSCSWYIFLNIPPAALTNWLTLTPCERFTRKLAGENVGIVRDKYVHAAQAKKKKKVPGSFQTFCSFMIV